MRRQAHLPPPLAPPRPSPRADRRAPRQPGPVSPCFQVLVIKEVPLRAAPGARARPPHARLALAPAPARLHATGRPHDRCPAIAFPGPGRSAFAPPRPPRVPRYPLRRGRGAGAPLVFKGLLSRGPAGIDGFAPSEKMQAREVRAHAHIEAGPCRGRLAHGKRGQRQGRRA